eukprot:COSAG06_NODE_199_length_20418_cov_43.318421_6_plen_59_part_00
MRASQLWGLHEGGAAAAATVLGKGHSRPVAIARSRDRSRVGNDYGKRGVAGAPRQAAG